MKSRILSTVLCFMALIGCTISAYGHSALVNDDATLIQEVSWGWADNPGIHLGGWKLQIGSQNTTSVGFDWQNQDVTITIYTNQSSAPYDYYHNYGMSYDLLVALGYDVPSEWQTNGVPTDYSSNDLGEYEMAADFFVDLDSNGTWDKSIVIQNHQEMVPNGSQVELWGAERMSVFVNHQYDTLDVGLYDVTSWLKPYYVALGGPGGGEHYDQADPKDIPVITQYGVDTGIPVTVTETALVNPTYEEYLVKTEIETYGFYPFARDEFGNIIYDVNGDPVFETTLSYDWAQYKADTNDYFVDLYGIGWIVPDDASISYKNTYGQHIWEITLEGANQSGEWNDFDFLFGTATCGNDVILGSVSQQVPEPATLCLLLLGLSALVRRIVRK